MTGRRIVVTPPGPKTSKLLERDKQVISPSYYRTYPIVVDSGSDCLVRDVDGNVYIDLAASVAVLQTGHCHPKVVEAIKRQAERLVHYTFAGFCHEPGVKLGEKLCQITPGSFDKKVCYGNSGAEAVEAALKMVRWHTGKHRIISFIGGFHGRTFGALTCTTSKLVIVEKFGPLLPGVVHVPYPYCYRCPFRMEYPDCSLYCVDFIDEWYLSRFVPPSEVAAFIFEPIQGERGYIVPPDDYFKKLKKLADGYGILLIDDEIQMGVGRTGKWWAIQHYGVEPDAICFAKGIASGMPLSGVVAKAEIMDWQMGTHFGTFSANPVSCAAALATLEVIEEERLMENAVKVGEHAMKRLRELAEEVELIGDVRGKGLAIAFELVKDRKTKEPAVKECLKTLIGSLKKGVLLLRAGESTVRICPPLTMSVELMDEAIDIIAEVLKEISRGEV